MRTYEAIMNEINQKESELETFEKEHKKTIKKYLDKMGKIKSNKAGKLGLEIAALYKELRALSEANNKPSVSNENMTAIDELISADNNQNQWS